MKIEKAKHTMAVLRLKLGLPQKGMADLLDVNIGTIQSIESGRMALSKRLADRVAFETGASQEWLLANDISKPIDVGGMDSPAQSFEMRKDVQKAENLGARIMRFHTFWGAIVRLISIASNAARIRKFGLFLFKLRHLVEGLESEFKFNESLDVALRNSINLDNANVKRVKNFGTLVPATLKIQPLSVAVSSILFPKSK